MSIRNQTEGNETQASPVDAKISDSRLVEKAREGDRDAYLQLWERHVGTARAVVATANVSAASAEAAVNRAFSRVLGQITVDLDPLGPFRPYLLKMLHEEFGIRADAAQATNVVRAFRRLPVRLQTVLWYSVVEACTLTDTAEFMGESEAEIAPLRDEAITTLRVEWLVELVCDPALTDACAWLVQRAGARARGELQQVASDRFDRHLAGCAACQAFLRDLQAFPEVLRHDMRPLFTIDRPTESVGDL